MKASGRIGVLAGALLLTAGSSAWGQQMPCTTLDCAMGGTQTMPGRSTQQPQGRNSPQTQQQPGPIMSDPNAAPINPKLEQDQARMRNNDRQKQLVADTQKLVALANELKADVEKSNKDTLSMDVIRKADEIDKLARSVRDKMKGS